VGYAVGKLIHRCRRCNRKLKNPASILRGIGSTCLRNVSGRSIRKRKRKKVVVDWQQLTLFGVPQQLELFDHSIDVAC
jgi:hypothetical protein